MANVDKAFGARPIRHLDGTPYNGKTQRYHIAATYEVALFVGDFVISNGTAAVDGTPEIQQAIGTEGTPSTALLGVIASFEPSSDPNLLHSLVDTAQYVNVIDSPDVIYEIQEDGDTTPLVADDMGNNADIIVAAGDTNRGTSGMEIDSTSKNTTTLHLRVLGVHIDEDNLEFSANCIYEVYINEHELKSTTGT